MMIAAEMLAEDDVLQYGVKGMRWGVRKARSDQPSDGKRTASGRSKPKESADSRKAREAGAKRLSEMTNKQIKTYNERRNLENQYRQLNPSDRAKIEKQIQGVLKTAGLGVSIYNLIKSPAGQAAIKAGKGFLKDLG